MFSLAQSKGLPSPSDRNFPANLPPARRSGATRDAWWADLVIPAGSADQGPYLQLSLAIAYGAIGRKVNKCKKIRDWPRRTRTICHATIEAGTAPRSKERLGVVAACGRNETAHRSVNGQSANISSQWRFGADISELCFAVEWRGQWDRSQALGRLPHPRKNGTRNTTAGTHFDWIAFRVCRSRSACGYCVPRTEIASHVLNDGALTGSRAPCRSPAAIRSMTELSLAAPDDGRIVKSAHGRQDPGGGRCALAASPGALAASKAKPGLGV